MSFDDFFFWTGNGIFVTGLYFVLNGLITKEKRQWIIGIIATVVGLAMALPTIKAVKAHFPELKDVTAPELALLFVTWALLIYSIYGSRKQRASLRSEIKIANERADNNLKAYEEKAEQLLNERHARIGLPAAHFYGRNTGFRIESAQFAAHDDSPSEVISKVRQRVTEGHLDVPVKWPYLIGPRPEDDPHPYVEKFLTVTFSVTGRENWEPIVLPNGWFFKTLDDLALQLKHIQQLDKNGMISSLSSDNWMTQVDQWEVMGRKARANLDLIHKLGRLVTIQTAHLDRIGNVDLLHEVEKLQHLPREES